MKLRILFAPLAVALATAGCGGDAPAPAAPATPARAAKKVAASDATKASSETALAASTIAYAYNPIGKRDPFRSPLGEESRGNRDSQRACSEPLCQWDLDQLTLVAVITGDSNPVAMVQDPKGTGYVVRRNARIGKQGGKVSAILRNAITVTEFWTSPDGKTTPNVINVGLKKDAASNGDVDLATGKVYQ
jgi:type IV pilus assembly protein PilP